MEISTFIYGIILIILIPVVKAFIKWRRFVNTIDRIPGPKSYPLIGTVWEFWGVKREDLFQINANRTKRYNGIYRNWIAGMADVRLERAEYVEKVLTSNTNITKSPFYDLELKKWLGDGLLIATGEKWHAHRKILTPTFHFTILEGFCDVFAEKCGIMVEKLKPFADAKQPVDIFGYLSHCALDIICETAMGIQMNAQETGKSEYVEAVAEIATVGSRRFLNPLYHYNWIFSLTSYGARSRKALKTLHGFTDKVIQERKDLRKRLSVSGDDSSWEDIGKKRRKAFLDLVLDEQEKRPFFTDKDIRQEVDTFMFAGHDTTTVTAAFALYLIGLHPDVQEKLYEEQLSIFGDSKELATHKNLGEMKYMDRVMKECIRVYPTVLSVSRRVAEEFEVGGYKIPVGAGVTISIYGVTRDERYYPDPGNIFSKTFTHKTQSNPGPYSSVRSCIEKFDPDRFLPENLKARNPYAFIPFSAGPRNCIGQKFAQLEEKMMLSTMIRNFKYTSVDSRDKIKFVQEIVARPVSGIRLLLEKRE